MKKFIDGVSRKVAVWNQDNIDTDMIIPSDFLKVTKVEGLGVHLFDGLRFSDQGDLYQNPETREKNTDFFLNKEEYKGAEILIAGENFGCGSSREHAPWALLDYGFKVIIAPSFADIFYENAFKNGLLLIEMDTSLKSHLIINLMNKPKNQKVENENDLLIIDLVDQYVKVSSIYGENFKIDSLKKKILLEGLDEIDITLEEYSADIVAFKAEQKQKYPWI